MDMGISPIAHHWKLRIGDHLSPFGQIIRQITTYLFRLLLLYRLLIRHADDESIATDLIFVAPGHK